MERKPQQEVKNETPLNLPESCLACRSLGVTTMPVYLIEKDGTETQVCKVAICMNCGYVKRYGIRPGIFKLDGKIPDFNMQYWPELRRNGITPDRFEDAIIYYPEKRRKGPIWLDARKGLKPYEVEGDQLDIIRRWERLIRAKAM